MTVRKAAGLLVAVAMFHLNVVEADRACSIHPGHHAAMMMHPEATASTARAVPSAADTHAPCETPVQVNCCQALASCSLQFGLRSETPVVQLDGARDAVRSAIAAAPFSLIVPPDPPPPRA